MLPNLLIIGVPKAGTTSIFSYLNLHKDVFGSNPKEPGYFHPLRWGEKLANIAKYEKAFSGYSNQKYELSETKVDKKNKIILIDMEVFSDTGSVVVTWRIKESNDRFFIIDLIVADISLVVTKRSEFNSMLKNVNYSLSEFNQILLDQNIESYEKIIN